MPEDDLDAQTRSARRWADTAWEQGWYEHAIDVIDWALRLHPNAYKLYRKRGAFYLTCPDSTLRDEEQGAADLRRACELSGWREDLVRWVVGVLMENGDIAHAKEITREYAKHSRNKA
jgi:Flp pilus assembly protein TadD